MQTLTENERFAPTQPMPEHQTRLKVQGRWARPAYTPNDVPLALRTLYVLISLTWMGWAMIGLLSGHMFFLVSKGGPIHFSGIPAMLFSVAVMAGAAACAVAIVDHCDRRDNEESYRRTRRRLWWCAVGFFCLSALVGLAERTGMLPCTDGALGLLSTPRLRSLMASSWLANSLVPHRVAIEKWSLIFLLWCFAATFAMSKLGLLKQRAPLHPGVALFMILFVMAPAVFTLTLGFAATLSSGSPPAFPEEPLRAHLAWFYSLFLTGVGLLACLGVLFLVILCVPWVSCPRGRLTPSSPPDFNASPT